MPKRNGNVKHVLAVSAFIHLLSFPNATAVDYDFADYYLIVRVSTTKILTFRTHCFFIHYERTEVVQDTKIIF